jgi:integrase
VAELSAHIEYYAGRSADDSIDPEATVFSGERGAAIRQNNFRSRVFYPACKRAGVWRTSNSGKLEPPRVHDLRHTAASLAARAGFSLHEVKEMLGHSTIKTTSDLYLHLFEEAKRENAERLGALMASGRLQRPEPVAFLHRGR